MVMFIDSGTGEAFSASLVLADSPTVWEWAGGSGGGTYTPSDASVMFNSSGGLAENIVFSDPLLFGQWPGSNIHLTNCWSIQNMGVYLRNGVVGISPDLPTVGGWRDAQRPDGDPWYTGVIQLFGPGMACQNMGNGAARVVLSQGIKSFQWISYTRSSFDTAFWSPQPGNALDPSATPAWPAYTASAGQWRWTITNTTVPNANLGGLDCIAPYADLDKTFTGFPTVSAVFAGCVGTYGPTGFGGPVGYSDNSNITSLFQVLTIPVAGKPDVQSAVNEPNLFARLVNRKNLSFTDSYGPHDSSDQFQALLQKRIDDTHAVNQTVTTNNFDILWGWSNALSGDPLASDILSQIRSGGGTVYATVDCAKPAGWYTDVDCTPLLTQNPGYAQWFWLTAVPSPASGSNAYGTRNRVEWLTNPMSPPSVIWNQLPFESCYWMNPQSAVLPYWEVTLWKS